MPALLGYRVRRDRASVMLRASETAKRPERERTREPRCAPEPNASPKSRAKALMYVPLLQAMRITASGRPKPAVSETLIRDEADDGTYSPESVATLGRIRGRGPSQMGGVDEVDDSGEYVPSSAAGAKDSNSNSDMVILL